MPMSDDKIMLNPYAELYCEVESQMTNKHPPYTHDYTSPFADIECLTIVLKFAEKRDAAIDSSGIGTSHQVLRLYGDDGKHILVPWPADIPFDTDLDKVLTILIGEVTARLVIDKRKEVDNHPFGYLANLIEKGIEQRRPMPATVRSLRKIAEVIEWSEASFTTIQVGFSALRKLYSKKTLDGLEGSRANVVAAISDLICHPTYRDHDVRLAADLWKLIASNEAFDQFTWFYKLVWKREAEMLAEWHNGAHWFVG